GDNTLGQLNSEAKDLKARRGGEDGYGFVYPKVTAPMSKPIDMNSEERATRSRSRGRYANRFAPLSFSDDEEE
ncbi:unnamed protein product, partial [Amoebophrya sp. A25]